MINHHGKRCFFILLAIITASSSPRSLRATNTENHDHSGDPCHLIFTSDMGERAFRIQLLDSLSSLGAEDLRALVKLVHQFLPPGDPVHIDFLHHWINKKVTRFKTGLPITKTRLFEDLIVEKISVMNQAIKEDELQDFDTNYTSFRAMEILLSDSQVLGHGSADRTLDEVKDFASMVLNTRHRLLKTIRDKGNTYPVYALNGLHEAIRFLTRLNVITIGDYQIPKDAEADGLQLRPAFYVRLSARISRSQQQTFDELIQKFNTSNEVYHTYLFEKAVAMATFYDKDSGFDFMEERSDLLPSIVDRIAEGFLYLTAAYNSPVAHSIADEGLIRLKESVLRQMSKRAASDPVMPKLFELIAHIRSERESIVGQFEEQSDIWSQAGDSPIYIFPDGFRGGVMKELERLEQAKDFAALNSYRGWLLLYLKRKKNNNPTNQIGRDD